jgi:hypothetical protein
MGDLINVQPSLYTFSLWSPIPPMPIDPLRPWAISGPATTPKKIPLPLLEPHSYATMSDEQIEKIAGKSFWSVCKYEVKYICNDIYVPITNIEFKSRVDFKYRNNLSFLRFVIDSWIDVFDDRIDSPTYLHYKYSILINNKQAIKIIENQLSTNKIYVWNLISKYHYYDSKPDVKKVYPSNYNLAIIPILLLLESSSINNLELYKYLNIAYCNSPDVNNILIYKNLSISKLFGLLTKNDLDIIITYFKLFNDYNSIHSKDITKISLDNIQILINRTCCNIKNCKNSELYTYYSNLLCNKEILSNILEKLKYFYTYCISMNNQNIITTIKKNKRKIMQFWDIVKYANSSNDLYSKDYTDSSC